jgi:hypothetical protein
VIFSAYHVPDARYQYSIVTGAPKKKQIDGTLSQEGFSRGHKPARQGIQRDWKKKKKQIGIKHTREGIGRGRREEEEGRESIGRGIRISSSLSRETRAERGGIPGMGPSSSMSASEVAAA